MGAYEANPLSALLIYGYELSRNNSFAQFSAAKLFLFSILGTAKRMREQEPLACKSACCSRGTLQRTFCGRGFLALRPIRELRSAW